MKSTYRSFASGLSVLLVVLSISLLVAPVSSLAAAETSPKAVILHAWERAQQSGSYRFNTRLVQTTHPAPSLANVGSGPRVETVFLEGQTDLETDTLRLRLWQNGGRLADLGQAAEVLVQDGVAMARQGNGSWQEIEDFTAGIAPGNDASAFLVSARNVERVSAAGGLTHYVFDISGPALADYLRDHLEDQLRAAGELPPGMYLDSSEQFRNTVGDGEVWLDGDNLPTRMVVRLEYPQQANGERVAVEMVTDFADFNRAAIALHQSPLSSFKLSLSKLQSQSSEVLLSMSLVGLLVLLVFNSHSKRVYTVLVIVVILSMVLGPLLQSAQVYAFSQKQAERAAAQKQQEREEQEVQRVQADLYGSDWDPHQEVAEQVSGIGYQEAGSWETGDQATNSRPSISRLQSPTSDEPSPDSDDDGDGLTYEQEIRLGTNPNDKDTDGDFITDNAEVAGFWYNNQWWYSNPANPDTNNDGLNDGSECSNKAVDEGDLSPEDNACDDTDGDGIPDIFDRDNDGDGVPDRVDLSPYSVVTPEDGGAFNSDTPLELQVDALQADTPVFVDFQIRPENADRLWQAMNVLDWPSGDERGQIMRKTGNDSTYADLGDPAANASNGDMRLIPMLEIQIPYKEGHYANLPVLDGAPARTPDTPLEDWLDEKALSDYGIAVRPLNDDGDLVLYVPLNLVKDETDGDRTAFSGRMLYWPTNTDADGDTDWGNTQQVRMVWLVQMLVDQCDPGESAGAATACKDDQWETDINQVVRAYDEEWVLTGLSVREDHGLEIAIAYEDPAQEPSDEARQYDDWLWALAHGLDQAFLTGRDQDGDGERDITVGEIRARWDNRVNSGTTDEERWGIPITAIQVVTFAYDHEDYFVHVMLTETQKILANTFSAYRDQGADAPTLLFAQEAQYRTVNLEDNDLVTQSGALIRVNLDSESVPQTTRAFLSWAPYRYNESTSEWENYPVDEYMDKMEVRLKDAFDEYQDEPDYEDILRGQILMAQAHYLTFLAGVMKVVQVNDSLVGNYDGDPSDGEMAKWINGVPFNKSGGVITRQTYTLANTFAKIVTYGNKQLFTSPIQFFKSLGSNGGGLAQLKSWWQATNWKKLKLGAAIAGAAIAIGALITAAVLYKNGNSRAALITLSATVLFSAVLDTIYTAYTVVKALKAAKGGGALATLSGAMKAKGLKYSGKAFSIAIVVVAVVLVATFLIAWGASGERWDSLAFTAGLATVLSSIIAMAIMMAIAAIPIVGQIIAAIVFLLDAIFMIVCHTTNRDPEDFFCQGISGYLAKGIQKTIFNQNIMVTLDGDDRLTITDFEQSFDDVRLGMSEGNTLITTVETKQRIRALTSSEIEGWMAHLYKWQYSDSTTKSTTFADYLDTGERNYHDGLSRGDIANQWQAADGDYFEYTDSASLSTPLTTAGINRPVLIYLNDAFAAPAQECWLLPNPLFFIFPVIPVCYVRTMRGTSHINLGEDMYYDVFPATFDDFLGLTPKGGGYALGWSQSSSPAFPRLADADGDGLRVKAAGGSDPDDSAWDSDLDGLSDFLEQDRGSDPLDVDSDDDGLTDYEEIILKTDPLRADTDYDGLTDLEEITGWEFVYDFAADGSQIATWVTSDPLTLDGDGDGFSDFQEKTYGFNPRAFSDPNILSLETQVSEPNAPHLLLRMDETANATAFGDDSGFLNNADCAGATCPAAGHYGEYGNAPQFDGTDDYLEISHNDSLNPANSLTLSAWVYLTDPNADQKILGKSNTSSGYVLGVGGGQMYPEIWDSAGARYTAHWGSIPAQTWTHLALTWESGGQMIGYINGVEVGRMAASANPIGSNENPLRIGIAPWNASSFPVNGRIDEVTLFTRALSAAEIQEVAAGRHNPNDLSVHPGDDLYYEATVTNELFNRYAQGLLSTDFPAAFAELPPQDFVLNPQESETLSGVVAVGTAASGVYTLTQQADALITNWREDSNYAEAFYRFSDADTLLEDTSGAQPPRDGDCTTPHCPVLATGRYGNGAAFDGVDDYLTADAVARALADAPAFTFGGWVYPESGMSVNGVIASFHSAGGANRYMLQYDPGAQKFLVFSINDGDTYAASTSVPDTWYHVMVVIYEGDTGNGYLYVNGVEEARFDAATRPASNWRFSLGQEWDGNTPSNFFKGILDEIAVFPRALTEPEIQEVFNNPIFRMPFDEGVNATTFEDTSGFGNHGTCQGDSCPASGVEGISLNAVQFDGTEHLTIPGSSVLNLQNTDFTLSAWVYPAGEAESFSDCPFRAEYYNNTALAISPWSITKYGCEDYPIDHRQWGGPSGIGSDYFSVRWTGTFLFLGGDTTFTFTMDDGMRVWLDDDQLLDDWNVGSERTVSVVRPVDAGWHTVTVEYFERTGDSIAAVSWEPGPLPWPQGILGAENYPALQRVGRRLMLTLDDTTRFITTDEVLTPEAWNHVAASFDGSTWSLYVDGQVVEQFNVTGQSPAGGQGFEIGRAAERFGLNLQRVDVLYAWGNAFFGQSDIRIDLQLDGSSLPDVWSESYVRSGDVYPLAIAENYARTASIEMQYRYGLGSYSNVGGVALRGAHLRQREDYARYENNSIHTVLLWENEIDSAPFEGKIDEVAIFKTALSADEVADLYNAGIQVLHLPLNDAPGASDFVDATGQRNGSCSGAGCPTAGVPGRDEMALRFDGVDDVVTIREANTADLNTISLAAWVKLNSTPGGIMRFVTVGDEKAVIRYEPNAGGDLHFYIRTADGAFHHLRAGNLQTDTWYHVVGAYDGATMRLYLDGAEVASQPVSGALAGGNTIELSHSGETLDGLLDEVIIYRRALNAAEVQSLFNRPPEMLLTLDEEGQATTFSDITGNGHDGACSGGTCPSAGVKGQVGPAAVFDGADDYIQVPHSSALNPGDEMTLMLWVKLEDTDPDQKLVGKSSIGNGFILGIGAGQLYPEVWDSGGTRYTAQWGRISAGYWTHLAFTWKTNGDLVGYINGNEVGRLAAGSLPIGENSLPLYLGIAPWNQASFPTNGRLDHVTFYTRALSPREIRAAFHLQAKWVEDRQHTTVTLDNENPVSELVSDDTYRPNQDVMLLVNASDATTFVTLVEMGVSTDGGATYTWASIPPCEDSQNGTAWCPTFEPTVGEGRYLLQFRATDNVGHRELPGTTYTILVDDTPPQAATGTGEGDILRAERQPGGSWLLPLNGTVADPQIDGSPGSGVAEVRVKLTDTDPVSDTLPVLVADLGSGTWAVDYPLYEADPTGTYTLAVQTRDEMGNTSEMLTLITLGVDAAPPEANLNDITAQTGVTGTITTTLTIGGNITETGVISIGLSGLDVSIIPMAMESLSGTVAIYHFDEPDGSDVFANQAGIAAAECEGASCPAAGQDAIWGTGLSFDGVDDYLTADGISAAITDTHGLAFGGWFYPTRNTVALLAFNDSGGGNRNMLRYDYRYATTEYRFHYADGSVNVYSDEMPPNQWYHVFVSIAENGAGVLYVNGQTAATFTTSVRPDPDGRFSIGQEWDGGAASDFFHGYMDEVRVYDRALSPSEVRETYAASSLANSGVGMLDSTWAYTLPATLDGLYQINIRPQDVYENAAPSNQWPVWNGQIDTAGPEVDLQVVENSDQSTEVNGLPVFNPTTTYTCWARDFNLVITSTQGTNLNFQCPCDEVAPNSTVITDTYYHEVSPWYAGVFSDTTRLYERTATCTVLGWQPTANYMKACDAFGHCTTGQDADVDEQVEPFDAVYSVIYTPTHNTILTSTAAINIEGQSFARDYLATVSIYDNNALVGTPVSLACPSGITSTQWTQAWMPTEGVHHLYSRAVACGTGENHTERNRTVYVDTIPPVLTLFPTNINRDQRLSYGRVQLSGSVSDATTGIAEVVVNAGGQGWSAASVSGDTWSWEWYLGEEPDNAQYTVTVRATDRAGWSTRITETVTVDLDVPNPITLTLTSGGQVVTPTHTLRTVPAQLDLDWQASEPPAKLSHYEVLWTVRTPTQTLKIPSTVPPAGPLASTYLSGEAQRVEPQVTSVFTDGNTQVDDWGPVYVDSPLTPDYVQFNGDFIPYRGWMESGCTDLGVDRRAMENAQGGANLSNAQNLYVTWDTAGLRITWVGANWDYNGDLFVYLDDLSDPSVPITAYNPFTATQNITVSIPGGKAFIWVQDSEQASLGFWNGTSWKVSPLTADRYRFDPGMNGGTTDLYIPFSDLGIADPAATPLVLYAFATDEGALSLWAAQPPQNPLNSPNVVQTALYAGASYALEWLHVYSWPTLGAGICPNLAQKQDADMRFGLTATPAGTTYGLLSDDLFWLGSDLTSLTHTVDLNQSFTFMDVDHTLMGNGDAITYTLVYTNHGSDTATGVVALATALHALTFNGSPTQTISIGDVAPGAGGVITFTAQVDTSSASQPDWAVLNVSLYDDIYAVGNPLDTLWADHQVDNQPPEFFGVLAPDFVIGAGSNAFSGYAYDPSDVPALTLEAQPPSGSAYQTQCPDGSPSDGVWSCLWDSGSASDGDLYQIRLRAADRYGQTSVWSAWRTYVVDTVPPVPAFDAATEAYTSTILSRATVPLSGPVTDNHGLEKVELCLDGDCQAAGLQARVTPPAVMEDAPGTGVAIGACGGGEVVRTFVISDSFDVNRVALGLNIDHPRRDELQVTLSDGSTTVMVVQPPTGTPLEAANLDVTLDDPAPVGLHVKGDDNTGQLYYDRRARPDSPLDAFYGAAAAGTWTLTICDANANENNGTFNRARLTLTPQNAVATSGRWSFLATGLEDRDYISHTVEVYATDLAGNRSDALTLTLWVDNVPPVLTVSEVTEKAQIGAMASDVRVMRGTVSDGGEIAQLYAMLLTPGGDRQSVRLGHSGGQWWLDLRTNQPGTHTIWVNAVDAAGNAVTAGPYEVTLVYPLLTTDSPTALGASTALTATLLGDEGGAYAYAWDFGDGQAASGQPSAVSHQYPAVGAYTATVTASAGSYVFTATTVVVVDETIAGLSAVNDSPTRLGESTALTATLTAGSNVTYAWDFGDGQTSANADQAATMHAYPPGIYTATVTAYNSVSVMTATTRVVVIGLTLENDGPTDAGMPTVFTATLTGDTVTSYDWDFGDGTSPLLGHPSPVVSHTYELLGVYTATVGVESAAGPITATSTVTITGLHVVSDSPTLLGNTTTFTAATSLTGTVTYDWDFGDGTPQVSGLPSPVVSHTYAAAGVYTATVTAGNGVESLTATTGVIVDGTPPTVTIQNPITGTVITQTVYVITGTASDDLTGVAQVEISTDGGATWSLAEGTDTWSYTWTVPIGGMASHRLIARATDYTGLVGMSQPVEVVVVTSYWLYLPLIYR